MAELTFFDSIFFDYIMYAVGSFAFTWVLACFKIPLGNALSVGAGIVASMVVVVVLTSGFVEISPAGYAKLTDKLSSSSNDEFKRQVAIYSSDGEIVGWENSNPKDFFKEFDSKEKSGFMVIAEKELLLNDVDFKGSNFSEISNSEYIDLSNMVDNCESEEFSFELYK